MGYQGWFHQPKKGTWFGDEKQVRIDMWPDVSEYEKTYPTGLKHADGSGARFFSSDDKSTVDLHFKWMKDYGLDGVFMQRFWGAAKPDARKRSHVLANAMEAARKYDRAIGVMYERSESLNHPRQNNVALGNEFMQVGVVDAIGIKVAPKCRHTHHDTAGDLH